MKAAFQVSLGLLLLWNIAPARADERDDQVRGILVASGKQEEYAAVRAAFVAKAREAVLASFRAERDSPVAVEIADRTTAKIGKMVEEKLWGWPVMEPLLIAGFKETYTAEEIALMARFLDSDAGKEYAKAFTVVTNRLLAQTVKEGKLPASTSWAAMNKEIMAICRQNSADGSKVEEIQARLSSPEWRAIDDKRMLFALMMQQAAPERFDGLEQTMERLRRETIAEVQAEIEKDPSRINSLGKGGSR
ncbi:MAG TPA: hypothetical protein VG838_17060 [Opitutaceae bacterium]|nr:hypothetical protein [Opitutaceae bacterium]